MSLTLFVPQLEPKKEVHPGDEELVARCKQELPDLTAAFELLLKRYQPLVLRTCQKIIGNREDGEEACQDVFIKIFHNIKRFEGKSSFKTWLYRIVYNTAITKAGNRAKFEKKTAEFSEIYPVHGQKTLSRVALESDRDDEKINQAFQSLSRSDREIMSLRFVSDLSMQEIADVLEIEVNAVKVRLFRAKEGFRNFYLHSLSAANFKKV
jgi:RNA polymerase sigma-70 factor, ECF subfamily